MTDPDVERSVATEMALLDLWEMRSRKADTTLVYDFEDPPEWLRSWRVGRAHDRLRVVLDRADRIDDPPPHPRHGNPPPYNQDEDTDD